MSNRLYTGAVFVFWLASMTWLVTERILPPFLGGEAPVSSVSNQREPVAWRIAMDGRTCGVAVLQAVQADGGSKEVHSVLQLKDIKPPKSVPLWLKPLLVSMHSSLSLEMRTRTTYDAFDQLVAFENDMVINRLETKIEISGEIHNGQLELTVRVGGLSKKFEHDWPSNATLSGELTPAGRLLPIYEGRQWSHEVYSPFASPKAPMEMIQAVVKERLRPTFHGTPIDAWRVEYRSMDKTGSTEERRLRAVMLVADDGRVLEHEVAFLGSRVLFLRESDERSAELAGELLQLEQRATVYRAEDAATDQESIGPAGHADGEIPHATTTRLVAPAR